MTAYLALSSPTAAGAALSGLMGAVAGVAAWRTRPVRHQGRHVRVVDRKGLDRLVRYR